MNKKFYEKWIAKNFYGMSVFSLHEYLCDSFPRWYADKLVYETFYNIAIGKVHDTDTLVEYEGIKDMVSNDRIITSTSDSLMLNDDIRNELILAEKTRIFELEELVASVFGVAKSQIVA